MPIKNGGRVTTGLLSEDEPEKVTVILSNPNIPKPKKECKDCEGKGFYVVMTDDNEEVPVNCPCSQIDFSKKPRIYKPRQRKSPV